MRNNKSLILAITVGLVLIPTGFATAAEPEDNSPQILCTAQLDDGTISSYPCPNVQYETFQAEVTPGMDPLAFNWYQGSRLSRTYWGPSYATSTEVMFLYYLGQTKAAANVYDGLRIVQVCAWYTRSSVIISGVACSTASSDTGIWTPGYVANTNAWDDLAFDAPKTIFVYRLGKINPNIF